MTRAVPDGGLARERTSLAWTRTALALLLNGLLVLVRHEHAFPLPVSIGLATLSFATAGVVLLDAARGSALVRGGERDQALAPGLVVPLGVAVTLLGLGTLAAVVLLP